MVLRQGPAHTKAHTQCYTPRYKETHQPGPPLGKHPHAHTQHTHKCLTIAPCTHPQVSTNSIMCTLTTPTSVYKQPQSPPSTPHPRQRASTNSTMHTRTAWGVSSSSSKGLASGPAAGAATTCAYAAEDCVHTRAHARVRRAHVCTRAIGTYVRGK